MANTPVLIKDLDYIINEDGNLVFTSHYLLKRGHCCQSGCLNCPYGHGLSADPSVPAEFNDAWDSTCEENYEDENNEDEEAD